MALVCARTARAEGPGIKLGDRLLLHLGLGAEFRYDDNVFFQSTNKVGAFMFRLLPTVDLATRAARGGQGSMVDFRLHAGLTYNEFITTDQTIAQHRDYGVQFGGLLTLNPRGHYIIDLFDNYVRSTQPPYNEVPFNYDRDTNELGARLRFAPGAGRLTVDLSYVFGLDFFEQTQLQDFDVLYHKMDLRAGWKFFPKTALYLEASEVIYQYQTHSGTFDHADSYPFHVVLGVTGLITAKLNVNAYVGYGNGFYVSTAKSPTDSPNTAVGGVTLGWRPTPLSTGSVGYRYDFSNSLLGSYYNVHSVFLNWTQLIWRFTGAVGLQYQNQDYRNISPDLGLTDSSGKPVTEEIANYISFDVRVDYPFKDWLIASVGYDLQYNTSPTSINLGTMAVPALVPVDYLKNEVWLRLTLLY